MRHQKKVIFAAVIFMAFTAKIHAQDDGRTGLRLREIVVTAQKREQLKSKIGITIDTFTGEDLKLLRATKLIDVAMHTPGVSMHEPFGAGGYPQITFRGMNPDLFQASTPQAAGVYADGVYLANAPMLAQQMHDVERVEVLKGPQGTLYGRNTLAGLINVITKRPTKETDGYVDIGYGNYERLDVEGAIGGSLSENVAARVSVKTIQRFGGPLTNLNTGKEEGEIDRTFWRAQLLYTPTDNAEILLRVNGGRDRSHGWRISHVPGWVPGSNTSRFNGTVCPEFLAGDLAGAQANCVNVTGYTDQDGDPYTNNVDFPAQVDVDTHGITLEANLELAGGQTITSLTNYAILDSDRTIDEDAGPTQVINTIRNSEAEQFSQEIRLASNADGPLTWIVGGYYGQDTIEGGPRPNSDHFDWFGGGVFLFYKIETETVGVFGHAEWELNDTWMVTGGLRHTWVDRALLKYERSPNNDGFTGVGLTDSNSSSDISGNLGLNFRPFDNTLIYATYGRGFSAGGYDTSFVQLADGLEPNDNETANVFELGFKSANSTGTFSANGAVFFYDITDFQVAAIEQQADGVNRPNLINAEGVNVFGVELELNWTPTEAIDVRLAMSHLDATFDGTIILQDVERVRRDFDGETLANSPEFAFDGWIRYTHPLASGHLLMLHTDFLWEDEIHRDLTGTKMLISDSHWLLNASAILADPENKWEVALWVKNLADDLYAANSFHVIAAGYGGITWNMPRTYGMSFRYNFF